ncbi:SPOR domain-containing protein [Haemophilus influenzae]|uniref:SPOR domain-containing protein n=1 Tax=Haemophilus influenzae TaxID=727 RepID=UPI002240265A|nr:SPOR domain-containing protein [Haemophilus influenzae]
MAHRDFAARRSSNNKKKNKKKNTNVLIFLALFIVLVFAVGLYLLKNKNSKVIVQQAITQQEKAQLKSVLPNRPEEVWSYIKALETRTVPVDNNPASVEQNMRLTEEQRQVLIQMERDQKAADEARKLAEQQRIEDATRTQSKKTEDMKNTEAEIVKSESIKKQDSQKIESAKKVEQIKTVNNVRDSKKFGLQCGAFKNRAQAENLQGRLQMTGLNAQIQTNGEWNRVRVVSFDTRELAVQAQSRAKTVTDCVVIGM